LDNRVVIVVGSVVEVGLGVLDGAPRTTCLSWGTRYARPPSVASSTGWRAPEF